MQPFITSPAFISYGEKYNPNKCPVSKKISESIVRLPFFNDLDLQVLILRLFL